MWLAGETNVAEEHFVTAITKMVLAQVQASAARQPDKGKTLLVAAVATDQHDLGVQVVADFFERDGWRVVCLGADMPIADLVQAVEFYQPDLLALSATLPTQLPTLRATIVAVRRTPQGATVRILVGGQAFDQAAGLATELGADGYAADPEQAVCLGNSLVGATA